MKKKVFLFIVLIVLFVFGILIYDFSDELDEKLVKNIWYIEENNNIYILRFKDNKLKLTSENGTESEDYKDCTTFQYNKNVSMLKLKCNNESKKIFIKSYDEQKLTINEDGIDKKFYSSKELALIENFKEENNLSDSDYNNLISINFNDDLFIDYKTFLSLLKGKSKVYIGIISNNISYENAYNYQALNNLIKNSSKKFYLLNINDLNDNDLSKLNKETNIINYDNKLYIYEVGNKALKNKVIIESVSKNDLDNYKNI